jgi:hypothetical protein
MTDNREEIKARIQNAVQRYEESQRQPRRRRTRSKKGEDTVVQIRGHWLSQDGVSVYAGPLTADWSSKVAIMGMGSAEMKSGHSMGTGDIIPY